MLKIFKWLFIFLTILMDEKIFKIYLNDKALRLKKLNINENLSSIRRILSLSHIFKFTQDNIPIDEEDEENFELKNLIEDQEKEPFKLKCIKSDTVEIIEIKKVLKIECLLNEKLTKLREKIMNEISEEFDFLYENCLIEETEECKFNISEITKNGKIQIKFKEKEKLSKPLMSNEKKRKSKKHYILLFVKIKQ